MKPLLAEGMAQKLYVMYEMNLRPVVYLLNLFANCLSNSDRSFAMREAVEFEIQRRIEGGTQQ